MAMMGFEKSKSCSHEGQKESTAATWASNPIKERLFGHTLKRQAS
jgi:hypothetical protein